MVKNISDFDAGLIIGLIVGEGSFTGDKTQPCISVKLHGDDLAPLLFLKSKLGGRIYGSYKYGNNYFNVLHIRGKDLISSLDFWQTFLPKSIKREQFLKWLIKYGLTKPYNYLCRTR